MKPNSEKYILADIPGSIKSPTLRSFYRAISYPLEWILGIHRLNTGYTRVTGRSDGEFAFIDLVKSELDVDFDLPENAELEKLRKLKGPIVFVSNHPFGGIEAFVIVQLLSLIRHDYKIMANFLLFRIRELQRVLFPVDPYETNHAKKKNVNQLKKLLQYLKEGGMIHVFPAGEVSSYKWKSGKVEDREWNEGISKIIRKTEATVIPLYFHGRNSLLFQTIGFLSPYIRTVFLPGEFVRPREKNIRYRIGAPITADVIQKFDSTVLLSEFLKRETYALSKDFS